MLGQWLHGLLRAQRERNVRDSGPARRRIVLLRPELPEQKMVITNASCKTSFACLVQDYLLTMKLWRGRSEIRPGISFS